MYIHVDGGNMGATRAFTHKLWKSQGIVPWIWDLHVPVPSYYHKNDYDASKPRLVLSDHTCRFTVWEWEWPYTVWDETNVIPPWMGALTCLFTPGFHLRNCMVGEGVWPSGCIVVNPQRKSSSPTYDVHTVQVGTGPLNTGNLPQTFTLPFPILMCTFYAGDKYMCDIQCKWKS